MLVQEETGVRGENLWAVALKESNSWSAQRYEWIFKLYHSLFSLDHTLRNVSFRDEDLSCYGVRGQGGSPGVHQLEDEARTAVD